MKIIYVDDEKEGINAFRRAMLFKNPKVDVRGELPLYSMEDTYKLIMEDNDVDAIVTDYELSDSCDVEFTGAEFIEYLMDRHPMLPCFVLTAFEDNAVKSDSVDVYHVYPKSVLHSSQSDEKSQHSISFYDRISQQVDKTKRKVASFEKELYELAEQRNSEGWTSENESRLIYLDDLLEQHHSGLGRQYNISSILKSSSHSDRIVELIKVTKDLLKEVENDAPDSKN